MSASVESTWSWQPTSTTSARNWDTRVEDSRRFAIVGLGGFATRFALPAIDAADHCRTTVLVSGSPAKAGRLAARVRTGRGPEPDGRDGLVDIRAIETIYESAETGGRVDLD